MFAASHTFVLLNLFTHRLYNIFLALLSIASSTGFLILSGNLSYILASSDVTVGESTLLLCVNRFAVCCACCACCTCHLILNKLSFVKSGVVTFCVATGVVGCTLVWDWTALGVLVTFGVAVVVGVAVLPDCVAVVEAASCLSLAAFASCILDCISLNAI